MPMTRARRARDRCSRQTRSATLRCQVRVPEPSTRDGADVGAALDGQDRPTRPLLARSSGHPSRRGHYIPEVVATEPDPSHLLKERSGAVGFVAGCAAQAGLDGLGLVHLLDDAQVELVGVRQVLDVAQRLVLAGRLELEVAVAEQPPSGDCTYFMSVTRSSGIMATLRVKMPDTTMTRLLVRMKRSNHQSATLNATQTMITAQISRTAVRTLL